MQTVTEILIDYSTSMQGDRINICKKMLLEEVLPMIDYSSKIGVKTFTASNDKKPSITPRQGLKVTNKEELTNAISSLDSPNGNTPIAAAIKNSVASLKEYRAFKKKIILITDGEENCNGDYEAEARKAKNEGIECEIHVIGLGLKANAIEKAKRITDSSGGTFSNLGTSTYVAYKSGEVKDAIVNLTKAIGKKSTNPVNYQANTGQTNISTQSTSRSTPKTPVINHQKPITQKDKPIEPKTVEPIQAEKPKKEISEVNQDENSEKEQLVADRKMIDNDYSKLTSTVETNSELLKDIVGELKSLKTEIKELKDDGIKISQEEEDGEVIIKENKELNEEVRVASEKYVFELLKSKYGERVKWLNENGESGQDHDFEVIDIDDTIEYYIECKGTKNSEKSFLVTKNEWRLFLNQTKNYQVFFVSEALNKPKSTKIDNLLDWILKGKVVPYSRKNVKLKSERVVLTILG